MAKRERKFKRYKINQRNPEEENRYSLSTEEDYDDYTYIAIRPLRGESEEETNERLQKLIALRNPDLADMPELGREQDRNEKIIAEAKSEPLYDLLTDDPEVIEKLKSPEQKEEIEKLKGAGVLISQETLASISEEYIGMEAYLHYDETSQWLCEKLNARAFAYDNHIFLGRDEYKPETSSYKLLLAHELAHVCHESEQAIQRQTKSTKTTEAPHIWSSNPGNALLGETVTYQARGYFPMNTRIKWYVINDLTKAAEYGYPNLYKTPEVNIEGIFYISLKANIPGTHTIVLEYGPYDDKIKPTRIKFKQKVYDLKSLTDPKVKTDLEQQNISLQQDFLVSERTTGVVRKQATDKKIITTELFDSWLNAHEKIIFLEAALKDSTSDKSSATNLLSNVQREVAMFYNEFRRAVATSDKAIMPKSGVEYYINDYFSNDLYNSYRKRLLSSVVNPPPAPKTNRAPIATLPSAADVIADYYAALSLFDKMLHDKLKQKGEKELAEYLDEYSGKLPLQKELFDKHPDAKKVRAVFYPNEVKGPSGQPQVSSYPIDLYYYKEKDDWVLVELRSKQKPRVNKESAKDSTSPPRDLFTELNTKLRFPKGILYWQLPGMKEDHVRTTEPWSVSDWLTWIGVGLTVAAVTAATLGAGTTATVLIIAGGIAGAGSGVADMVEKSSHEMLTAKDIVVDLAAIVAGISGGAAAGFGRIARVALTKEMTGNMARLAVFGDRIYKPLILTNVAADVTSLVTFTTDAFKQYEAIDRIEGGTQDKQLARERLLLQLMLTGGVMILGIRGQLRDFSQRKTLYLDVNDKGQPLARRFYNVDPEMHARDIEQKIVKDGEYLKNPTATQNSELINPGAKTIWIDNKKAHGVYMYVIDENDNLIMGSRATQYTDKRVPHPMLIGGKDPIVKAAGMVYIYKGRITKVDNSTGHFKTGSETLEVAKRIFNMRLPKESFSDKFEGFLSIKL